MRKNVRLAPYTRGRPLLGCFENPFRMMQIVKPVDLRDIERERIRKSPFSHISLVARHMKRAGIPRSVSYQLLIQTFHFLLLLLPRTYAFSCTFSPSYHKNPGLSFLTIPGNILLFIHLPASYCCRLWYCRFVSTSHTLQPRQNSSNHPRSTHEKQTSHYRQVWLLPYPQLLHGTLR